MITTTTDGVDGRTIAGYLGVVSGDAVMGTNIFRDMFAGIRDLIGGRSGSYEKELGADAIVGVDLDYESIGSNGKSMLMVSANGTAVKFA